MLDSKYWQIKLSVKNHIGATLIVTQCTCARDKVIVIICCPHIIVV